MLLRPFLTLATLLLPLSACAMRPAEAAPAAPLAIERFVPGVVAATPLAAPTRETSTATPLAATTLPALATATATQRPPATATRRPPTAAPPSDPVGLKLTQPIDGNGIDGVIVRILQPGFKSAGMSSLGFRAYARVSPGRIADGNGIRQVRFSISGPNGFQYEHSESRAPYCLFRKVSGSQCRALRVGDLWWGTKTRIAPGAYVLRVEVQGGDDLHWESGVNFRLK